MVLRTKPRSAKPDDPIYSGGYEMFSRRAFNPSSTNTPQNTDGATQVESHSAPETTHPLDGEDISIRPSLISNGVPRDRWPSGKISPQQAADLIARYGSKAPSTSEKPQD